MHKKKRVRNIHESEEMMYVEACSPLSMQRQGNAMGEIRQRLKHTKTLHKSADRMAGVLGGMERDWECVKDGAAAAEDDDDEPDIFDFDSWHARRSFLQTQEMQGDKEANKASGKSGLCNNSSQKHDTGPRQWSNWWGSSIIDQRCHGLSSTKPITDAVGRMGGGGGGGAGKENCFKDVTWNGFLTLCLVPSLFAHTLSLSLALSRALSLSHTHTVSFSLSLPFSFSLSFSLSRSLSLAPSSSCSLFRSLSLSLSPSLDQRAES